ncbi:MAG: hypothetical protein ACFFDT_19030, partial [Candidatus Hodarchaeota archaeon]
NSIKKLFFGGELNKALDLIEQLPVKDKLRGSVYKSGIFLVKGQYQQFFQLINEISEKGKQESDRFVILGVYFFKNLSNDILMIARWLRKPTVGGELRPLEEVSDLIQSFEHFNDEQTQEWISLLYCYQSMFELYNLADLDRSLKSVNTALTMGKKIKSPIVECIALIQLGEYYTKIGDLSLGFEHTQQAFTLASEKNLKLLHCALYRKLGELSIQ